jgi:glucokinase
VADIGGTNVRFARVAKGSVLQDKASFPISQYNTFDDAVSAYLKTITDTAPCCCAALAAAGPVHQQQIKLTNNDWIIRADTASRILGGIPVHLYNDLQAAALSIPVLPANGMLPVIETTEQPERRAPRLAVNVGTGFGASVVIHAGSRWHALAGEAGHMGLSPARTDSNLLESMDYRKFRCVEDMLSGRGLQTLYTHFATDKSQQPISPKDILQSQEMDAVSGKVCDAFTQHLASVCGDLVLAYGAWGGVYLFGSVALEWSSQGIPDAFSEMFMDKGLLFYKMKKVPMYSVTIADAPLIGMAHTQALVTE